MSTSTNGPPTPESLDDLTISIAEYCRLAETYADQKLYSEATDIFQRAIKRFPDDVFLKISFSKMLDDKARYEREFWRKHGDKINELRRQDDTLCNHYTGLGFLYLKQGKHSKAIEMFELAKHKNPSMYLPFLRLGELYASQKSWEKAKEELLRAKTLNKFDEKIYHLLGRIYVEEQNYDEALACFIDASFLSGKDFKDTPYHQEIRESYQKSALSRHQTINQYIHDRSATFIRLMDIINRLKGRDIENIGADHVRDVVEQFRERRTQRDLIDKVERLRSCILVQELTEPELYQLSTICQFETIAEGTVVFKEHDPGGVLYAIHSGQVRIARTLSISERVLAEFDDGSYFGEMDFLDNLNRSSDARTTMETKLFTIERDPLMELFSLNKVIAVKLMIVFWKTLALRIRDANEMLKTFFNTSPETVKEHVEDTVRRDRSVEVSMEDKIEMLRDKGLTEKDITVLASLTNEELYHKDELIFAEGSEGSTLYFILDGKVRVTKNIPGVGEEAIAIMERGNFFGEMSLIDNSRRSADVRAHEGPATVLTISKQMLDHILFADMEMAYQFLGILCRSLSWRLRTINDMICTWHVMSGGF